MLDEFALPAAPDLGTALAGVVVFGCTSAGALRGNDFAGFAARDGIARRMERPVVTSNRAVLDATLDVVARTRR